MLAQPQQRGAQQRARAPGRTAAGLLSRQPLRLGSRCGPGSPRRSTTGRGSAALGRDDLHRRSAVDAGSVVRSASWRRTSSARLAPARPRPARRRAGPPTGTLYDGAAGLELIQEPQPLLRERQRQRARSRTSARSAGPALRAGRARLPSTRAGQRRRPWAPRTGAQRQLHPEAPRGCRETTWVASSEWPPSSKKSSWTPTCVDAPAPRAQMPASSSSVGVRGATYACASSGRAPSGAGSALRSTLPLGVSGSASSATNAEGTMYSRQRRRQEGAQRRHVAASVRRRGDVGHQPLVAGHVLADHHHGLAHRRVPPQRRLDLAQLDAEAAHLHLVSARPEELQLPVRQPAHQVAGAVQPRAGLVAERVGDEALRRQLRPAQVAARQAARRRCTARPARPPAPAAARASSTYSRVFEPGAGRWAAAPATTLAGVEGRADASPRWGRTR